MVLIHLQLSGTQDPSLDVMLLLNSAIKFADLNHSSKPLPLHLAWTSRITNEFWELGDKERQLGMPVSPLCDRKTDTNIPKSQIGFFQFVCVPYAEVHLRTTNCIYVRLIHAYQCASPPCAHFHVIGVALRHGDVFITPVTSLPLIVCRCWPT